MSELIDYLVKNRGKYNELSNAGKEYAFKNCQIKECVDKLNEILKEIL